MLEKLINNRLFQARIAATIVAFLAATPSYADNCDLNKLEFGMSQEKLKSTFKLNTLDVATIGEGIINTGGSEICKDLPPASEIKLLLLDDKFVQMVITNENTSGELLAFAQKTFDKQDNPRKQKKTAIALWNKENKYSVMYSTFVFGRRNLEQLTISSAKHQKEFDKHNEAKNKAFNEEDTKSRGNR